MQQRGRQRRWEWRRVNTLTMDAVWLSTISARTFIDIHLFCVLFQYGPQANHLEFLDGFHSTSTLWNKINKFFLLRSNVRSKTVYGQHSNREESRSQPLSVEVTVPTSLVQPSSHVALYLYANLKQLTKSDLLIGTHEMVILVESPSLHDRHSESTVSLERQGSHTEP
ncbi:hypothetical protein EDB87DRAFT_1580991 [Lactarius vividus]|nr:hypothetical protein EDB87DRAFT_1580991 [Lactarius vividus]